MKHSGRALTAALQLAGQSLVWLLGIFAVGLLAKFLATLISLAAFFLIGLWLALCAFVLWFFRDPDPRVPQDAGAIVAPAHGKVDVIEETTEPEFLGGLCRRISIFLSLLDIHIQQAPVAGRVGCVQHTPAGATKGEEVLIGFDSTERPGEKYAVRLIAGRFTRRVMPWAQMGDHAARGERIGLIQLGCRVDLYLPLSARVAVRTGDRVVGGETIIATRH